jgi:uncharacterized metal-binding protein
MGTEVNKVGIISCSGEGLPEGTVSRLACRKVLDAGRPGKTVTICLPLFIAGGEEERRFTAKYPTVTIDGCEKLCAAKATERLSGKPARSLVIREILRAQGLHSPTRVRNFGEGEQAAVRAVAGEIAKAVDGILAEV